MKFWITIYRFSWGLFVLLCAICVLCFFVPKLRQHDKLQRDKAAKVEEIHDTQAKIAELQRRQEQFSTDPRYVEHIARQRGMVKANELVVRIGPSSAEKSP
jgi:cell division protein FtsB